MAQRYRTGFPPAGLIRKVSKYASYISSPFPKLLGAIDHLVDQATRWLAFALTEVEKGFRRISGYADLPCLIHALEQPDPDEPVDSLSNDFTAHKISV
ncbi:MAG: hypothetical protein MI757_15265, partial [Pirellulales bacterium]|nr:hypothetical protein [Pirellulales bacterium]